MTEVSRPIESATGGTRIQSVARAARLLLRVAADQDGIPVKDLAADLQLALPTTYHLVNTLLDEGLLSRNGDRRYVLGEATAVLARAYLRNEQVSERLLETLRLLSEETQETVYLADWEDGEIRVRASMESARTVRVGEVAHGHYEHAHARANGKVLLAWAPEAAREEYLRLHPLSRLTDKTITSRRKLDRELRKVKESGIAEDHEEYEQGVSCLAAPALVGGEIVAAFGISVPTDRFRLNQSTLREILTAVVGSLSNDK